MFSKKKKKVIGIKELESYISESTDEELLQFIKNVIQKKNNSPISMHNILVEGLNAVNSKHKLSKQDTQKLTKLFPNTVKTKARKKQHNQINKKKPKSKKVKPKLFSKNISKKRTGSNQQKSSKHQKDRPGSKEHVIPPTVLLVDGYIRREFIKPYNAIYPFDLTKIFCEYLDHIWVCPDKYNYCMTRNGTRVVRPSLDTEDQNVDMIIGSSRGYCKGVFEFQLECIRPAMDAIGIMSQIEECQIEQWISATKGNTYYYVPGTHSIGGGGIYSGAFTKNAPAEQFMANEKDWRKGDRIKIRVDCDHSTCKFFKNNKKVGKTIHIEPNCYYHPVLATSKDGSEYVLIMD